MSTSRALSRSFSNQSRSSRGHSVPSTRAPKKRKASQEHHTPQSRQRKREFRRTDLGEDNDEHLCSRCRTIDFEAIFGLEPTETITQHGINVCDLGELNPSSKDTSCDVCSLFAHILKRNQQYESSWQGNWHLRAFTAGTLRNRSHAAASRAQDLSIVIALSKVSEPPNKHDVVECVDRGVILPRYNDLDTDYNNRSVCYIIPCHKKIDFSRLEEMLLGCDTNHLKCRERREKMSPFPVGARVIDCQTRDIVPLEPAYTYVALSYVWGAKSSVEIPSKQNQDSKAIGSQPATIEDAISITIALGLQYLWVDRVCIDQTQSDDTQRQLAQMGRIYSHSYVTICALGDHDDVGFPGVSFNRKSQPRARTQDLVLSWTGPSIRRNLDFSKWRDRGWTYQESVLSRRCLFFTEHFVALSCDSDTSTENVSFNYFHTWSFNRESELYGDTTSWGRVQYPAQELDKHLQEFQRRKLTYVADTLNAFKGILSELSVKSYWGVPIYKVVTRKDVDIQALRGKEQAIGFITGLCWRVTRSSHTSAADRESLPSWSWAGQKYARGFANCLARSYQLEVAQTHFSVFHAMVRAKRADDSLVSLQQLLEIDAGANIVPEQTQYLEIRSVMIRWQRQMKSQSQTNGVGSGLEAKQVGENGWWRSDHIGELHLDPSYDELTKPHDNCGDQDQICRHILLKSGSAILLALDVKKAGNHTVARAIWMVLEQIRGGIYRRRGIIISNQSVKFRSPIACPAENMLETILLG